MEKKSDIKTNLLKLMSVILLTQPSQFAILARRVFKTLFMERWQSLAECTGLENRHRCEPI